MPENDALLVPVSGFRFTPTACVAVGAPSFAEWQVALNQCEHVRECLAWWIGDLLNYGEARWGEMYVQAVQTTGLALQTLMNYKAVAKAIPPEKRVAGMSWSAHRLLAFRPDKEEALAEAAELARRGEPPTAREVLALAGIEPTITVRFTASELRALYERTGDGFERAAWDKIERAYLSL